MTAEPYWDSDLKRLYVGDNATLGGVAIGSFNSDATVVCERGATDIATAANLRAAYAAAKLLTPGGNALSATNRATVIYPGGRADFGVGDGTNHGLLLDTQYVDLISLTGSAGSILTSQIVTASRGTVEQTASDVRITGFTLELDQSTYTLEDADTDPAAYFPDTNLTATVLEDVVCQSTDEDHGFSTRIQVNYAGTYRSCSGGLASWGGSLGSPEGGATGSFYDVHGTDMAFGEASGEFEKCVYEGEVQSTGVFTGVAKRCRWVVTDPNQTALVVGNGAKVYYSEMIGTGSGYSVDGANGITAYIGHCLMNKGINGTNVTNGLTDPYNTVDADIT